MKYEAVIRSRFTALHNWPEAPEDVAFLRHPHRHEFHVEMAFSQIHTDRDVEFVLTKRALCDVLRKWDGKDLQAASCEMMAEKLITWAMTNGFKPVRCSVFEDGENGAVVYV